MKFMNFDGIVIYGRFLVGKKNASVLQFFILHNYTKFGGTDSNG
jgi:hypothetical protein